MAGGVQLWRGAGQPAEGPVISPELLTRELEQVLARLRGAVGTAYTPIPWAASHYSADSGLWSVTPAHQKALGYWLHQDRLILQISIQDAPITATPNELFVRLPEGLHAAYRADVPCLAFDATPYADAAHCYIDPTLPNNAPFLRFRKTAGNWATPVSVFATIQIPIDLRRG
jgi:hypothetical protein